MKQRYGTVAENTQLRKFVVDFVKDKGLDIKNVAGDIIRRDSAHHCIFIDTSEDNPFLDACTVATANSFSIKILSTDDFLKKVDEIKKEVDEKKRLEEEFESVEIGNYLVEFLDGYLKVGCQKIPYETVEKIYGLVQRKKELDK